MTNSGLTRIEVVVRWVAALTIALLVTGFVWTVSADHSAKKVRGSERAHQYAQGTADRIRLACSGSQAPAVYECIAKEIAASREDQRDEYDLSAQQQMADWAFWTMVIGSITTMITAWALWYVKGTLDETRAMTREAEKGTAAALLAAEAGHEANRMARGAQLNERMAARIAAAEARRERQKADERAEAAYALAEGTAKTAALALEESKRMADAVAEQVAVTRLGAERQLRAYLSVVKAVAYDFNNQNQPNFEVIIKNQGQTPAYEVRLYSRLNWTTDAPEDVAVEFSEPATKIGTVSGSSERAYTSASAGFRWPPGLYERIMIKKAVMVYSGVIVYRDAFRKRRFTTFMTYLNVDNIADDIAILTLASRGNNSN